MVRATETARLSLFVLLFAFGTADAATLSRGAQTPVSGVVDLLKQLQDQINKDGKKEEDLYESFVCWGKSVVDQKTAMNEEANRRVEELQTYVSDLDNGRIELTSERTDLEKEIEQLNGDIEIATEMRNKQNADFGDAKDEMDAAVQALTDAIAVLHEATRNHTEGSLVAMRSSVNEGVTARAKEAAALNRAVALGEKFLTKSDAHFMKRLLTGDVPKADWKKLNRKATFKSSYKARSFKIQDVLTKLLSTFQGNLQDATDKENDAQAVFDKLMTSKEGQRTAAKDALSRLDTENGAKGMSKADALAEISDLQQQVTDDTRYIQQVTQALADKKVEWQDRQTLRASELKAISEAIAILANDDTRDLFKRSFASQGFLQVKQNAAISRQSRASAELMAIAQASGDRRLIELASTLRGNHSHFDSVISAIEQMIGVLQNEEAEDLRIKETCEDDRATNTRKAALASRAMDELTDTMRTLSAEIEELSNQIASTEKEKAVVIEEMVEAKRLRDDETAAYNVAKKDDQDAKAAVDNARTVLKDFYDAQRPTLVQTNAPGVVAGEAPPPPPTTWEDPNLVKSGESSGIVAILKMISEDIQKDLTKADNEEIKSQQLYDSTKSDQDDKLLELGNMITGLNTTRSGNIDDLTTATSDRSTKKGELSVFMSAIVDAASGCDFFTVNYPVRTSNRHIEIDGLQKAKAILQGAKFDAINEDRALKPGDAFVQRRSKNFLRA